MTTSTIIWIFGALFAFAAVFIYICIGFMQLFFERVINKDVDDKSYITVYQRLYWKKSAQLGKENPGKKFPMKSPEFKKFENNLQIIVVAFWPVFAVAEIINHYIQHKDD